MDGKKRLAKRKRKSFLYRHLPWLVPTAIAVLFVVLILAIPPLRRVVLRQGGAGESDKTELEEPGPFGGAPVPEEKASLESSEPGMEVLPPAAAKTPGRNLPRLLLVGSNKQMFRNLEEAFAAAIPGDIIEIRSNRPLLVGGAEKLVKTPGKTGKLTIRAGKDYYPILRGVHKRPMMKLLNVNAHLIGLHFTAAVSATCLETENSSIEFQSCTFSKIPVQGAHMLAAVVRNTQKAGKPVRLTVDHCFLRHSSIAQVFGPAVEVRINDSGVVGLMFLLALDLADRQQVHIRQSTFQNAYLMSVTARQQWPATPLAFRMERCIFAFVACCPDLAHLSVEAALAGQPTKNFTEEWRRAFSEFKVRDNIAQFWEGWWGVVGIAGTPAKMISEPVFEEFPTLDHTMRFGPRIEQVRHLIHQKGTPPGTDVVWTSALPEDLICTSKGALAERMKAGLRYGCDVTRLPVPPPLTLQAYTAQGSDKKK